MTLLELSQPLFRYVCALNRLSRQGVAPTSSHVQDELEAIFSDMRSQAQSSPGLAEQFEKVEFPLLFFVDNVIVNNTSLPFAQDWPRLAIKRGENNGDEDFFKLLNRTLDESGAAAAERLAIFYTCIGLGFTGWYTPDTNGPETLRRLMRKIEERIRPMVETDDRARVTPDAYKHTNTENLIQPPAEPVTKIVLVLVALTIVMVGANIFAYRTTTKELRSTLIEIQGKMQDFLSTQNKQG